MVSKIAGTPTWGDVVDSAYGCFRLQQNLEQLGKWIMERQMELNSNKCEVACCYIKLGQDLHSEWQNPG